MKAIITAAGLGTRLLPMSKELPKEMLPIYVKSSSKILVLKPLLQLLFEQLYNFGIRDFCFIVGRGKRAIEDHFTPDYGYISRLSGKNKLSLASEMESFYRMIESSNIIWVNQPEPRGFGHAVLIARPFVGDEDFLVCAGDTYVISRDSKFLNGMVKAHFKYDSDVTLLLQEVSDPRKYGVATTQKVEPDVHRVLGVVEKPSKPPSNLAVVPIYVFDPLIMNALRDLKPGVGDEIQLTDAIQNIIGQRGKVYATFLEEDEIMLEIGTPESYWEAVKVSYGHFAGV